jgi:hypothetical protein
MQEARRCAASTVSRWMSVVRGFYRACTTLDRRPNDILAGYLASET